MRTRARRAAAAIAFVAAAAVSVCALYLLASRLVTHELAREAQAEWTAWNAGATPWQWTFAHPDDVIAGRAFGHAALSKGADGMLRARSLDGSAYELGLPLSRDADLRRATRLRVDTASDRPLRLWVKASPRPQAPTCSAPLPPPSGAAGPTIWTLDTLHWTHADGRPCPTPMRAFMLRLRIQQPAGSTLRLSQAALLPRPDLQVGTARTDATALPADPAAAPRVWGHAAQANPAALPQVQLPAHLSPQQQLTWRDRIHDAMPSAIVWPAGNMDAAAPHAGTHDPARHSHYIGLALYALLLLYLALRPPSGRWAPWIEVAACMAGPLWLIVGLHLTPHGAKPDLAAVVIPIAYALWIEYRARPANWQWLGQPRDWLWAALPLPLAGLMVAMFSHGLQTPSAHGVLVYLLWALLQQWLMLVVVGRRLQTALPRAPLAVLLACALLFALLHTPNARLMELCFVAELWWAWCFLRGRALLPIATAHAASALLLQAGLAGGWLRSLEVSARYFMG